MSPSLALAPTLVLILSTFSSFRALAQIDGTCYFPAGNIADNNVPCDPDAAVSSCCAQESSCLANGLCLVNNDDDTVEFARGACTDPTFQDPACFQHCHGCGLNRRFFLMMILTLSSQLNPAPQIRTVPPSLNAAQSASYTLRITAVRMESIAKSPVVVSLLSSSPLVLGRTAA